MSLTCCPTAKQLMEFAAAAENLADALRKYWRLYERAWCFDLNSYGSSTAREEAATEWYDYARPGDNPGQLTWPLMDPSQDADARAQVWMNASRIMAARDHFAELIGPFLPQDYRNGLEPFGGCAVVYSGGFDNCARRMAGGGAVRWWTHDVQLAVAGVREVLSSIAGVVGEESD